MKKLILVITALITVISSGSAQQNRDSISVVTDFRTKLMLGLKMGGNYSKIYDSKDNNFKTDGKLGFATGAFISIPISKLIGIQPEVLFSQRGYKASSSSILGNYSLTRTTSYLDIPILFAVKPSEYITILAGPQYSYLVKSTDVFTSGNVSVEQQQQFKNQNLRTNTLCFTGGVDLTMKHLVISTRVGWDLQDNTSDGNSTVPRYKNVWYQMMVGYRMY